MMNDKLINDALNSPLAASDPSLGTYAFSQTAWNAIKHVFSK